MLNLVIAGIALVAHAPPLPRIIHASIFKNGYAFVTREIPVAGSGEVEIDTLPTSTYGTLWFAATNGVSIKQITTANVSKPATVPTAGSIDDLLRNNFGHHVILSLRELSTQKDLPPAEGNLKTAQGDLVILTQGGADRVVFKSQIIGLSSPGALNVTSPAKTSARVLKIRVESEGPGHIYFVSLEKGISWDTAYLVELKGGKLTLTTRATIVDDLDDIDDVDVMLSTLSPSVSSLGSMELLLAGEVRNDGVRLIGGQGLVGDSIDFVSYDPTDNSLVVSGKQAPSAVWAKATGLAGEKHEDQFFYRQPEVRLKRGDRGQFVLSQRELPYTNLYTLDIAGANVSNGVNLPADNQQAYHHIAFKNETGEPLTDAIASFMSGGQLIGQSEVAYTPVGGDLEYTVGAAPEVRATAKEDEVNRKRGARTKDKQALDQLTMRGEISIRNLSSKKIKVRVSRSVSGEITRSSNNAEKFRLPYSNSPNASSFLKWTLDVDPGKTLNVDYEYRAFVSET